MQPDSDGPKREGAEQVAAHELKIWAGLACKYCGGRLTTFTYDKLPCCSICGGDRLDVATFKKAHSGHGPSAVLSKSLKVTLPLLEAIERM